jgi:hypothetical protein
MRFKWYCNVKYILFNNYTNLWLFAYYVGHFLPEEDDKFLERVQAAVEEEERQAIAAADTDATRDAIATAEESRKPLQSHWPDSKVLSSDKGSDKEESIDQIIETENNESLTTVTASEGGTQGSERQGFSGAYESVANLPLEFYHYYHGSNTDMGTLIEVISISSSSSFYIPCKIQLSTVFN